MLVRVCLRAAGDEAMEAGAAALKKLGLKAELKAELRAAEELVDGLVRVHEEAAASPAREAAAGALMNLGYTPDGLTVIRTTVATEMSIYHSVRPGEPTSRPQNTHTPHTHTITHTHTHAHTPSHTHTLRPARRAGRWGVTFSV